MGESFIEEFRDEGREKESELLISIDGPSGSGKGTLASFISDEMSLNLYSAGDFFRKIAEENGMTVEELSQEADKDVDVEIDKRTLEKGLSENCIIESRISSKVLGTYSDFRIYVKADLEERAKRVKQDLENRDNEEGGKTVDEVKERIKKRDRDNNKRYKDYYGIEMWETDRYHLILDNTDLSIQEQNQQVKKVLKERFPDRFE